jgi:large subunit ribosomal protein L9
MEVILIDDVLGLGRRGDVAKVADGYGRNYLIPKKLAVPATKGNLTMVEQQRLSLAKKEAKYVEEAELLAQELGQLHVLVSRKAGEEGVLFGSVTSKDIGDVLTANGINLDRRKILLAHPLKNIGNVTIEVRPHRDVSANLLVSILPEGDESVAKTLKRGEESDEIVSDLDSKVSELAGQAVADSEPPV